MNHSILIATLVATLGATGRHGDDTTVIAMPAASAPSN